MQSSISWGTFLNGTSPHQALKTNCQLSTLCSVLGGERINERKGDCLSLMSEGELIKVKTERFLSTPSGASLTSGPSVALGSAPLMRHKMTFSHFSKDLIRHPVSGGQFERWACVLYKVNLCRWKVNFSSTKSTFPVMRSTISGKRSTLPVKKVNKNSIGKL